MRPEPAKRGVLAEVPVLSEFGLHTEQRDTGHGKKQPGFAGTLTIRLARDAPDGADRILGVLARFAEFSGTVPKPPTASAPPP
jgi:hypothetical protein